jgi:hypothetical protein
MDDDLEAWRNALGETLAARDELARPDPDLVAIHGRLAAIDRLLASVLPAAQAATLPGEILALRNQLVRGVDEAHRACLASLARHNLELQRNASPGERGESAIKAYGRNEKPDPARFLDERR